MTSISHWRPSLLLVAYQYAPTRSLAKSAESAIREPLNLDLADNLLRINELNWSVNLDRVTSPVEGPNEWLIYFWVGKPVDPSWWDYIRRHQEVSTRPFLTNLPQYQAIAIESPAALAERGVYLLDDDYPTLPWAEKAEGRVLSNSNVWDRNTWLELLIPLRGELDQYKKTPVQFRHLLHLGLHKGETRTNLAVYRYFVPSAQLHKAEILSHNLKWLNTIVYEALAKLILMDGLRIDLDNANDKGRLTNLVKYAVGEMAGISN